MTDLALTHTTVLLAEAVQAMLASAAGADGAYVDGTFGRGGHAMRLLAGLSAQGRLVGFDKDPDAVAQARRIDDARFEIRHEGFSNLSQWPQASVDGVLLDLGVSSPQIDNPDRGFSFRFDGPLDMRMDTTRGESVAQWLETATAEHITEVIRDYGEERFAFQIAKALVARRQESGPVRTTSELAQLVADTVKTREPGQNPATRTFQAFRIFINAELQELEQALAASVRALRPGGRLVVISFHSLEDRIVKQFIAKHSKEVVDRRVPYAQPQAMALQSVARIRPSEAEVGANKRARSAIMRVAQRTEAAL